MKELLDPRSLAATQRKPLGNGAVTDRSRNCGIAGDHLALAHIELVRLNFAGVQERHQ